MRQARILIVEDEVVVAADLAGKLERAGYGVLGTASRGEQALRMAEAAVPDLVLMDIRLAGPMDGIETAERLRATVDVPVVFLTAHSDRETIKRASLSEPFGYVLKPFEERDLAAQVEIALYKHQAERRLRDSEARYRTLVESAGDAILTLDEQGAILSCNAAAERMFGYSREDLPGRHVSLLMPGERLWSPGGNGGGSHGAAWVPGSDTRRELDALRRDGAVFPVEACVSGTLMGGRTVYTAIVRDLSERRRAEAEVHWRASLLEQAHEAVIVWRVGGGVVYWNAGAAHLYGWSAEEAAGRAPHELFGTELAQEADDARPLLDAGQWSGEMTHRTKDGRTVIVESRMRTMPDGRGGTLVMTTNHDVTDRHVIHQKVCRLAEELERRVEERTEELKRSQELLRQLASELTLAEQRERRRLATDLHDYLAQLLVCVRLKISQIRARQSPAEADPRLREAEEVLQQALEYTRSLVAQLAPIMLHQFGLPAALQWLGEQMQRQDLTVHVDVGDAGGLTLPEDQAVLLFQSVRELLMNVAKHARVESASVRMRVADGHVRLVVSDQGAGCDLAEMAQAGGAAPKFGLFSIRERMKALGGHIDIVSAPGRGTTATITLPLGKPSGSECSMVNDECSIVRETKPEVSGRSDHSTLNLEPSTFQQHTNRVRVLLVDDHVLVRQGLRTLLGDYADVEVVGEAGDGVEAVAAAAAVRPDVVLMDVNMPNMDGVEATARIRQRDPSIVVIGLSMHNSGHYEKTLKEAGAVAYLSKESVADHLYHAIVAHRPGARLGQDGGGAPGARAEDGRLSASSDRAPA